MPFIQSVLRQRFHCSNENEFGNLFLLLLLCRYMPRVSFIRGSTISCTGVTFDTGGISIKPSSGMGLMRGDMGGAAVVAASVYAAAKLQLPVR